MNQVHPIPVIGILNVSDRASAGIYEDIPGKACAELLREWLSTPFELDYKVVPDEQAVIEAELKRMADVIGCALIVTTGGTGFGIMAMLAGVEVDVWHSSTTGMYENQDPDQAEHNLRGKFHTDAEGRFSFRSILPAGYPIPVDGPVGDMVLFQKREPWRPAHIHFLLHKPGFKTLVTQVFVQGAKYLETDVVFGVTKALVGDYRRHETGTPPAPDVTDPWYTLDYTFHMEEGESGLPKPPIK